MVCTKLRDGLYFVFFLQKLFVSSQKAEGMGGHNDSSASEKKLSEAANVVPTLNAENLQSNMKVIYYRFVLITS